MKCEAIRSMVERMCEVRNTVVPRPAIVESKFADGARCDGIDRFKRLVEEQHRRIVDQRHRQRGLLAHAAGTAARKHIAAVFQIQHAQQLGRSRLCRVFALQPVNVARKRAGALPRSGRRKGPDSPARRRSSSSASIPPSVMLRPATVASPEVGASRPQHIYGGRFPRAVVPHERANGAFGNFEGEIVDGGKITETPGQIMAGNHSVRHFSFNSTIVAPLRPSYCDAG